MAKPVDILKHARALIAKRGGWTKGSYARDINKKEVPFRSEAATCFCADGAIMRAALGAPDDNYLNACLALSAEADRNIVLYNDAQKTKRPVIAAFDRAIAKLEAQNA